MPGSDLQCFRFSFHAMGSPCSLQFYCRDAQKANGHAGTVIDRIAMLEKKYSRYDPESLLSRVNRVAEQGGTTEVDAEMLALLNYADACYRQSDGLFDITSGVLREAWDFTRSQTPSLPDQKLLDKLLESVGWQHIAIEDNKLKFLRQGMALDLGGIVKEYAADLAAGMLREAGITSGIVELGGDIRAVGPHPDGSPWIVKIRNPLSSSGSRRHVSEMHLYAEGLATSGDYERFLLIDGRRYSHLLSPETGWPVCGLASVTVKAPQCVVAGSSATIAMLKGVDGKAWLASLGVEYHAVESSPA